MVCVPKSPRRLFYKWTTWGVEIEYPNDIPTPTPEITVNSVQVTLPPTLPNSFLLWALESQPNGTQAWRPYAIGYSITFPVVSQSFAYWYQGQAQCHTSWTFTNHWGQQVSGYAIYARQICGTPYVTPGSIQQPRCDLLVGSDRIINPTINTPCPTWRLAGGICPPDTILCDDQCMPCDSLVARIEALMV